MTTGGPEMTTKIDWFTGITCFTDGRLIRWRRISKEKFVITTHYPDGRITTITTDSLDYTIDIGT